MLLSKKIKIEVSHQDAQTLEFMQAKCRGLYNWQVMQLRDGKRWPGWRIAKKTLQASKQHDPELNAVYGKLLAEVYFRLDKAMKAFYRRVKAGETPGFPRVRPRHSFFTLCYPASYIPERKTLLEQLSFQSSQVGNRVFAEAPLLTTSFLAGLQLRTEVSPCLVIGRLQISGLQVLLFGDEDCDQTNRTTHDDPRNGSPSARRSALMGTGDPKTVLQIIVGTREVWHIVTVKKPRRKVLGDLRKMIDGGAQHAQLPFLLLHLGYEGQIVFTDLGSCLLLVIA